MFQNIKLFLTIICACQIWIVSQSSLVNADTSNNQTPIKDIFIGLESAPVTIVEYASLGCSHCANFHLNTLPKLKSEYINKGKVKLIFKNFPLGTPSLAAAMIARCSGKKRFLGMIEIFFRSQKEWTQAERPIIALKKIARFGGLNEKKVDECLSKQDLLNQIQKTAEHGQNKYNIKSTPSFVINGKLISGNVPFEDFKTVIDTAIKRAQ